jgi:hypothetical protein
MTEKRQEDASTLWNLSKHVGKWALVYEDTKPSKTIKRFRNQYGLDVTTRKLPSGSTGVWVRWPVNESLATSEARKLVVLGEGQQASISWRNPPKRRYSGGRPPSIPYVRIVRLAKSRPGHWLRLGVVNVQQQKAATATFTRRRCEVSVRTVEKELVMWVRAPKNTKPVPTDEPLNGIVWEDIPVRKKHGIPSEVDLPAVVNALFAKKGRWALVSTGERSECDAVSRWLSRRGFNVAVRHLPSTNANGVPYGVWGQAPPKPSRYMQQKIEKIKRIHVTSEKAKVVWGAPPKPGTNIPNKYTKIVADLKKTPGKTIFLGSFSKNEALNLYHGLKRRKCFVKTHQTGQDDFRDVWAKYPDNNKGDKGTGTKSEKC